MPNINIVEIDQSRYTTPAATPRVVALVPGITTFGPVYSTQNPVIGIFEGKADIKRFSKEYGSYVDTDAGINSYEYVMNLLYSNVTVIFARINEGATVAGGDIVPTDDVTISVKAKHPGTFGNKIIVGIRRVDPAVGTDYIVYVSNADGVRTSEDGTLMDTDITSRNNVLENFRISTVKTSPYFVDKIESDYIQMFTLEDLTKLKNISEEDTGFYKVRLGGNSNSAIDGTSDAASMRRLLSNYKDFYANFADPYIYDFDFVTTGGVGQPVGSSFAAGDVNFAALQLASTRGDCVALMDLEAGTEAIDATGYAKQITSACGLDTSYGALYAPYAQITSNYSNSNVIVPPSLVVLMTIGYNLDRNSDQELWYAPAGVTRARATFVNSTTPYEVGSAILSDFQNNNTYRVNPIMKLKQYGYTVFGQATTLQGELGVAASALESLNVRLVCNVVKKAIFAVCTTLSFEYNTNNLWSSFYTQMDETLRYIQTHQGISGYRITMDEETNTTASINARTVKGRVVIVPTLCGEYFDVDFVITPAGVTLTEGEAEE